MNDGLVGLLIGFVFGAVIGGCVTSCVNADTHGHKIAAIANAEAEAIRIDTPDGPKYYIVPVDWKPGDKTP